MPPDVHRIHWNSYNNDKNRTYPSFRQLADVSTHSFQNNNDIDLILHSFHLNLLGIISFEAFDMLSFFSCEM